MTDPRPNGFRPAAGAQARRPDDTSRHPTGGTGAPAADTTWARIRAAGPLAMAAIFIVGVLFWGGFNTAMEMTNTEGFCISCHEMAENVYKEYQQTIHYQNRTGVRATCPDCHVPRDWTHKIIRKVQASNELWHKFLGSIDTPQKFDAKRLTLAEHEWDRMRRTDSRECRNCHNYDSMDYAEQGRRSSAMHQKGFGEGKTCIDCHKGIAHTLPPIEQNIGTPKQTRAREAGAPGLVAGPSQAAAGEASFSRSGRSSPESPPGPEQRAGPR